MTDLDRSLQRRLDNLRRRADRCADIAHRLQQARRHPEWVLSLWVEIGSIHTEIARIRRSSDSYDRAFQEANEDPTGQALDAFPVSE